MRESGAAINLAPADGDTPATSALIQELRRQVEREAQAKLQKQQLALPGPPGVGQGGTGKKAQDGDDDSSSSEDEELPPDPQNCTVSGPGFTVGLEWSGQGCGYRAEHEMGFSCMPATVDTHM